MSMVMPIEIITLFFSGYCCFDFLVRLSPNLHGDEDDDDAADGYEDEDETRSQDDEAGDADSHC